MKTQSLKGFVEKSAGGAVPQCSYNMHPFLGCGIHLWLNQISGSCRKSQHLIMRRLISQNSPMLTVSEKYQIPTRAKRSALV